MNGMEKDIVYTKEEVEWHKMVDGKCFGCLFFRLKRSYCNTSAGHCSRPDGRSFTNLTTKCGIEPPKTHD